MKPTTILLTWLLFILLEAFRNWYMIEIKKMNIHHERQAVIRSAIGVIYWIVSGAYSSNLDYIAWLFMPIMMCLTFWAGFDCLLNTMRGKPLTYFGAGSKLDRLQSNWPQPWVFFKTFFALLSVFLYYKLPDLL